MPVTKNGLRVCKKNWNQTCKKWLDGEVAAIYLTRCMCVFVGEDWWFCLVLQPRLLSASSQHFYPSSNCFFLNYSIYEWRINECNDRANSWWIVFLHATWAGCSPGSRAPVLISRARGGRNTPLIVECSAERDWITQGTLILQSLLL